MKGESAAPVVAFEAQLGPVEPVGDPPVEIDPHTPVCDRHIIFMRLLQSQSQAGTASAEPPHENPNPDRRRLPVQAPGNLLSGVGRNCDHLLHLHNNVKRTYTPYGIIVLGGEVGVKTVSRVRGIRTGEIFGKVEYYPLTFA